MTLHLNLGQGLTLGFTLGLILGFDAPTAAQEILPMPVPPEVVARDEQGRTTVRATRLTHEIRRDGRRGGEV